MAAPPPAHSASPMVDCPKPSVSRSAVSDTSDTPSVDPYTTTRSLAYHILAVPAYILHGATRPLEWAATYVVQEFPDLFTGRRPPRGLMPVFELGGPIGVLAGLALYDNHLFGSSHSARIQGLFEGLDTFETEALYQIPGSSGSGTRFETAITFFSDAESEYFRDGNDGDVNADETLFARDQLDVTAGVQRVPPGGVLKGAFDLTYEHAQVRANDGLRGERLVDAAPPGLGTAELLTSRLAVGVGRTRGRPRTHSGTEAFLELSYTHDLTSDRFRHVWYAAEVRQYVPVGIFPNSRRLALRARYDQVEPLLGGSAVPFYQLPDLGGQSSLRGFESDRFQNDGSLSVNVEYRYPIWSNADAVVFVDSGQVFNEISEFTVGRLHWSYGGGLHLLREEGLGVRLEVAGSSEGARAILTVDPSFRRIVR